MWLSYTYYIKEIVFCIQNANIIDDSESYGRFDLVNSDDISPPPLFLVDQEDTVVFHPYNHHVRRRKKREDKALGLRIRVQLEQEMAAKTADKQKRNENKKTDRTDRVL